MFTNKQSLLLTGVVGFGFFIAGVFNLLDNLIIQIVLGSAFVLTILNLFMIKKDEESDDDEVVTKNNSLHKS